MGSKLRRHLTYANVVSTACLFIVLGGGAYAATVITGKNVKNNSLTGADVKDGSLTGGDVKDKSLTAADFSGSVEGPKGDTGPQGPKGDTGPQGPATGPAGGALAGNYPSPGLASPEPWHEVTAASTTSNACTDAANTAVFCSAQVFQNVWVPWKNYGGSLATAAFYRDQLGIVHLKGVVSSAISVTDPGPTRREIFRLPTGYRPETSRIFASVGAATYGASGVEQEAAARVDVQADGLVVMEEDCQTQGDNCSANGPYLTLDGISFRPDE